MTNPNPPEENLCYEICESEELGRYLIAKRSIDPLEVVIREKPLVCAPADDPNFEGDGRIPMCLGCFARISFSSLCSKCGWPLCQDAQCQSLCHHSENECKYLSVNKISLECLPFPHLTNETIFILRCLLFKKNDPILWEKIVLRFEHHTQMRKSKPECVAKDEKVMANFIAIRNGSIIEPSWFDLEKDEVVQISGIINVNAFSSTKLEDECRSRRVRRRTTVCQCLYPTATLLAHQCIPNASWTVSASPHFEQTIRTTMKISKGEMISIAYAPQEIMWPTLQRLISTDDVAHFICQCYRCLDPTELKTFIGAIKCSECDKMQLSFEDSNNYLLPETPTEPDSLWSCQNVHCDAVKTTEQVVRIVHRIERRFNKIKNSAYTTTEEVEELEELYNEGQKIFHPNHYLLQEISLRIVNKNAFSVFCLNAEDLDGYISHCNSILKVSSILSPGFCRARALVQFFLSQALLVKVRKMGKGRELDKSRLVKAYKPIVEMQKEAFLYFKTEDENDNRHKKVKGINQYVACLLEQMEETEKCFKALEL